MPTKKKKKKKKIAGRGRDRGDRGAARLSDCGPGVGDVLTGSSSLGIAADMLFELISYITGGERREKAKDLARGADPYGDAATLDVLAALQKFPDPPRPEAFIEALDPLQPRLYSIACSPKIEPRRIALTVDAVRYTLGKRRRLGAHRLFGRAHRAGNKAQGIYTESARLRSAHRSIRADHHDRSRHGDRAVSRFCKNAW